MREMIEKIRNYASWYSPHVLRILSDENLFQQIVRTYLLLMATVEKRHYDEFITNRYAESFLVYMFNRPYPHSG